MDIGLFMPPPFSGKEGEDVEQFIKGCDAAIAVNKLLNDPEKVAFYQLKLKDNALTFFNQIADNDKNDVPKIQALLRKRYNDTTSKELLKLKFENERFIEGEMSISDYKTKLEKMATICFEAGQQGTRVREHLIKSLPSKLRRKALNFDTGKTTEELVTHLAKSMMIEKLCPSADHDAAFHVLAPSQPSTSVVERAKDPEMTALIAAIVESNSAMAKEREENKKRYETDKQNRINESQAGKSNFKKGKGGNPNYQGGNSNYQGGQQQQSWPVQAPQPVSQPIMAQPWQPPQQNQQMQMMPPQMMPPQPNQVPMPPQQWQPPQNPQQWPQQPNQPQYQNPQAQQGHPQNNVQWQDQQTGWPQQGGQNQQGNPNQQGGGQQKRYGKGNNNKQRPAWNFPDAPRGFCRNCGQGGHMARECPTKEAPQRDAQIPYEQAPTAAKN